VIDLDDLDKMAASAAANPPRTASDSPTREPAGDAGAVRDIIVAIDAGHGGEDPGAIGPNGTREKDVVLAIARRLQVMVDQEPGMRAGMIRSGDYYVSLGNRIRKAREQRADLFISIHADAFRDQRARGASVYTLSQRGASSEYARLLADKENASDLVGGVSLDDKDNLLASVLLDLSQTATIEASNDAAGRVLGGLRGVGQVHKVRVEQAGFRVLKAPDVPSMLVETAFISNPAEERKLRSSSHQNELAKAVMSGIRAYFEHNPPPGTRLARNGREHIISQGETLVGIARNYRVNLQNLRDVNGLRSDAVRVGDVLRIPPS
jgi:N-acetylmuramoyl-L-alanine amidase